MRLVSSFLGANSELPSRQSKSNRVSLLLNTSKSKRKEAFKNKCSADEWIADARDEGATRVSLSLEPSKSRKAAIKKVGTIESIAEDAREDVHVIGSKRTLDREDAERQGGEVFPAIHVGPYEEKLAGSGSFPFASRRVKVNRQNVAVKDDQKRRYANELCHILDQFVFDDHALIHQVHDHSLIAVYSKELATSKEGVPPLISTDLDHQSIPLKKLVCGERYVCADYIDDAAEGLKDMMTGTGGCNGNEIIEYIADWDGESYDSSTYESLSTIEAKIRESLRSPVSADSNDVTVESDLSMSQCARSTRSFEENFRDDIEVSAAEFKAATETNKTDVEGKSEFVFLATTADVDWNCPSVGSVLTEILSSSFIGEEQSIVHDTPRDSTSTEIQRSKGNSFGDNEDHIVATSKSDAEESSLTKLVRPKKNTVLKSFFSTGKTKQDAAAPVTLESNDCDQRQNAETESLEDAREEISVKRSVDHPIPEVEADSSFACLVKSVKSNILNHIVVVEASSEESVSMPLEETTHASNMDKQERAGINVESTSRCVNTITMSKDEEVKLAGNGIQGHGEQDQIYEAVAIEMKLSDESERSNFSQRMNESCSDSAGGVDTFLQFDSQSSYPYEIESMPPKRSETSRLDFNEKEASPSNRHSFNSLSGRCNEIEDGGAGLGTIPAHTKPGVDTGTAQWAKSIVEDVRMGGSGFLSPVPAHTKANVDPDTAQWIQNIDWDSFLNEGIKSKSIGSMSPAASKSIVMPQSERKLPTKVSMVKSFFGKTKKKRYFDQNMGEEAKHVSFVP